MNLTAFFEQDFSGQRVLLREDFNVPLDNGHIQHDARLKAAWPTIQSIVKQHPKQLIMMSHLGRPKAGEYSEAFSLSPVAEWLSQALGQPVLLSRTPEEIPEDAPLVLLENTRFFAGETENDESLGRQLAALCDIYVMDAFASSHRAHASVSAVAKYAKLALAGPLLIREVAALEKALKAPKRPLLAIIGGSKVSSKLQLLQHLIQQVDQLIIGGGMANTFLAAQGYNVGQSLFEPDLLDTARDLMVLAKEKQVSIGLPEDVVVAESLESSTSACVSVEAVGDQQAIFDIGPKTQAKYASLIAEAKTICWNGPVGVFEKPAFEQGTKQLAKALAKSAAFTLAGGGDTLSAMHQCQITEQMDAVSTGGGAFLAWMQGDTLPGLVHLK